MLALLLSFVLAVAFVQTRLISCPSSFKLTQDKQRDDMSSSSSSNNSSSRRSSSSSDSNNSYSSSWRSSSSNSYSSSSRRSSPVVALATASSWRPFYCSASYSVDIENPTQFFGDSRMQMRTDWVNLSLQNILRATRYFSRAAAACRDLNSMLQKKSLHQVSNKNCGWRSLHPANI